MGQRAVCPMPSALCLNRLRRFRVTPPYHVCMAMKPFLLALLLLPPAAFSQTPNFHQLDSSVYRSAQPRRADFAVLEKAGIREVISLRRGGERDKPRAQGTGLILHQVSMRAGHLQEDDLVAVLQLIAHRQGPVLIHCWKGSDRTGVVSALYRMVFQGWTADQAVDEMTHGGYGFHKRFRNIPRYLRSVDVGRLRSRVFSQPG
jgi:tyrosine-protein phosphatase SIW14